MSMVVGIWGFIEREGLHKQLLHNQPWLYHPENTHDRKTTKQLVCKCSNHHKKEISSERYDTRQFRVAARGSRGGRLECPGYRQLSPGQGYDQSIHADVFQQKVVPEMLHQSSG